MIRILTALAVAALYVSAPTMASAQGSGRAYMGCIHEDYPSKRVFLSSRDWVNFKTNWVQIANGQKFKEFLQSNNGLREDAFKKDCDYSLTGEQQIKDLYARTIENAERAGMTVVFTPFTPKSVD